MTQAPMPPKISKTGSAEANQATPDKLLSSMTELQSLNEELRVRNAQLQEKLDLGLITASDLQNVLHSTDLATLFLDTELRIRLFTPATKIIFNIIPSDMGRPLSDLRSQAVDAHFTTDALSVLKTQTPVEREIESLTTHWFVRRILPYLTEKRGVEGVVITYTDITDRKRISKKLEATMLEAEQANLAKSRFLAAVSHDLRQPLQSLTLLQGLLAKMAEGVGAEKLIARLDDTVEAMSEMLNTLLDINQLEVGQVRATKVSFSLNDMLERLRTEFSFQAEARNLELKVVTCHLHVFSDPALLEQIMRNLISNALKYTKTGSVLIGARRSDRLLSLEVWDTGIGIPPKDLGLIFDEYHQVDNPARQRSQGLGLGLSIVQRLSLILEHPLTVFSQLGKGTVFKIGVERAADEDEDEPISVDLTQPVPVVEAVEPIAPELPQTKILVVEDDPEVRELLTLLLEGEGHTVRSAADGPQALELVKTTHFRPDIILADYNLPSNMNGSVVAVNLRTMLGYAVPAIILTGDISLATERVIAAEGCVKLNKPMKLDELKQTIATILRERPVTELVSDAPPEPNRDLGAAVIYVVDDEPLIRVGLRSVLNEEGFHVEDFASGEAFLSAYKPGREACLLIDAYLPGMSGLDTLQRLLSAGHTLPAIMITGQSDIAMAIAAMKAGAVDFLEKPVRTAVLIASLKSALAQLFDDSQTHAEGDNAVHQLSQLSQRQRQVMDMVLAGHPSKNIAADLNISQRTVESHRAAIMTKTGSKSLPALARLAVMAAASLTPGQT